MRAGGENSDSNSGKDFSVLEERGSLILGRQLRCFIQLPVDAQIRVVPANAALGRRGVVVGGFVEELGEIAQHHETMGKTFRHPELTMVVGRQAHRDPFAEMRRGAANVHGHVQHFTGGDADQFALSVLQLVMQAAQYAFLRAGMVVLNELGVQAGCFFESLGVETLIEEAALVTKYLGFDDQNTGQVGGDYIHGVSPAIGVDGDILTQSGGRCEWCGEESCSGIGFAPTREGGLRIAPGSGDISA